MKNRKAFYQIENMLLTYESNIILLLGLRKVGKTTVLQQLASAFGGVYLDCKIDKNPVNSYCSLIKDCDKKYLFIDEIGYLPNFDEFMRSLPSDLNGTGKKVVITSSAYGVMKQLCHESLGGSRSCRLEMYPLSFEEYLYFSDKIKFYNESYEPTKQDIEDFWRLKDIPDQMRFIIDDDYMMDIFYDTVNSRENQLGIVRDIILEEEDYITIIDILAYTLNREISIKRFKSQWGAKIAKIIAYMCYNGFLFVDCIVNEHEKQSASSAVRELSLVTNIKDLEKLLKEYTFSVVSPLLYTRLLVNLEDIAGQLYSNPGLFGEMVELTMKSEILYKAGYTIYPKGYKYLVKDNITGNALKEVDVIIFGSHGLDVIMEVTVRHKTDNEHYVTKVYPKMQAKRILTDEEGVWKYCENYWRIGYPKALLMASDDKDYIELFQSESVL